jgi:hypothetical protein
VFDKVPVFGTEALSALRALTAIQLVVIEAGE